MAKEIHFYKVDKEMEEEDMNKWFGQHLIRIGMGDEVYVMSILQYDGKKLDFNEDAEELMGLTEYITGRMKEIEK